MSATLVEEGLRKGEKKGGREGRGTESPTIGLLSPRNCLTIAPTMSQGTCINDVPHRDKNSRKKHLRKEWFVLPCDARDPGPPCWKAPVGDKVTGHMVSEVRTQKKMMPLLS